MSNWINVSKELPIIPNGQEGIEVLVIIFDRGDYSRNITTSYYKPVDADIVDICRDKVWFHCKFGSWGSDEGSYMVECDEVTNWMYIPDDWKDCDTLRDYIENNNQNKIMLKFKNDVQVYPNLSVYFALDYKKKKFKHWNYIPDFKYKKYEYMVLDGCRLLLNISTSYKECGVSEHLKDGTVNPIMYELQDIKDWIKRYKDWLGLRWLEMSDILDTSHNVESILEAINEEYKNDKFENIEKILLANQDTIEYISSLNINQII